MSSAWSFAEDVVPLIAFATALVAIAMIPVRQGSAVSRGAKWFFVASIGCYLAGVAASILSRFVTVPAAAMVIVRSTEELWIPFLLFGVYSLYARQQLNDAIASQHSVEQAGEMMESLLETTPAGIVVLDAGGSITFANEAARTILDLDEDSETGRLRLPEWTLRVGDREHAHAVRRSDFGELVGPQQIMNASVVVEWPNGWRRRLAVNVAPAFAADGHVTGAVAAFVDREPWKTTGH